MKEARGKSAEPVEKTDRKCLISLLYKPLDEVKKITREQIDKVIEGYPLIGIVHDIVKSFKNTLFSKEPDESEKTKEKFPDMPRRQVKGILNGCRAELRCIHTEDSYI